MSYWLLASSIMGTTVLLAQIEAVAPVPLTSEPSHHQVITNDLCRVFHVHIAPQGSTLFHRHDHDYVLVHLTSSQLINVPEGDETRQSRVEAGSVQFVKAPLKHVLRNAGDSPYESISVEILRSSPQHPPGAIPAANFGGDGVMTRLLFETDVVRAWETEIEPGGTQAHHVHLLPYLAIAMTDLRLKNVPDKGAPGEILVKAGEVSWVSAPYGHTLTNVSDGPARFIALEFK